MLSAVSMQRNEPQVYNKKGFAIKILNNETILSNLTISLSAFCLKIY